MAGRRKLLPLAEVSCVLCVCLLAVLLIGQWLNLSHQMVRGSANSTTDCADNLHLLSVAVNQYAQDYDEVLPPMQNAQVFQVAVGPYTHGSAIFYCPETGLPYTPNAAVSGKALSSLSGDTDTIEVARDSQPHADGLYTVVFLDGTVEHGGQIVGDPNDIVNSRAKTIGLAATQYIQDYDETLPPMHTPEEFQTALYPYTRTHRVFYAPNGKPFLPNASLSGVSLASIADPSSTLLLTDQPPYVRGAPLLEYVDGHVVRKPLSDKHILWTNTSGRMALWTFSAGTSAYSNLQYGPYPGWSSKAVAVGPDNLAHLLWGNVSGEAALWTLDSAGGISDSHAGPYPGWSGAAIAMGADAQERLLWNNTNGQVSLWTLPGASTSSFTQIDYGPYPGWFAAGASVSR